MTNEVDSTNLESIKANRKKVSSPRFGGSSSALMKHVKGKKRTKSQKKTVVKG
jgi:hypothetical protein